MKKSYENGTCRKVLTNQIGEVQNGLNDFPIRETNNNYEPIEKKGLMETRNIYLHLQETSVSLNIKYSKYMVQEYFLN